MTTTQPLMDEARKLIDEGNCADCINDMYCDCFDRYSQALKAAYQRGREEERAEQDRRTEEYPKRWAERYSAIRTERDKG